MASTQHIRSRITGIDKTKQITRSMRLVSSAKVQKARAVYESSLPHYQRALYLMDILAGSYETAQNRCFAQQTGGRAAVLVISTDRGLCGAYNMNLARRALRLLAKKDAVVIAVGSKVVTALQREKAEIAGRYMGISETPVMEEAAMIAARLLQLYQSGEVDEVYVVRTCFENMLEQHAVAEQLLPYIPQEKTAPAGSRLLESPAETIVQTALSVYLGAALYKHMAESSLCEQSARVNSMDAAARNSDELVQKLTLQYNQMRQGGITNQIIEIMGGAAAAEK